MLTMWMGYTLLFSAAIAAIAFAVERILAIWSLPRRFVWIAAVVTAGIVPVTLAMRRPPPPAARSPRAFATVRGRAVGTVRIAQATHLPLRIRVQRLARRADVYVRGIWFAASLLVIGLFARGIAGLSRRRAGWREDRLRGTDVLVSADAGPAVVGVWRPRIVVPEWALRLGATELGLLLRHEREHVDAGDPNALLFAAIAVIAFPWNAAIWFMVHRLRLAIEIDCDARVLRSIDAPREYGLLLLAVGERRSLALPLSASLAERRSLLERRIQAMTMLPPRYPLLASLPFAALALAATVAAAQSSPPVRAGAVVRASTGGLAITGSDETPAFPVEQVRALVAAHHPSVIDGNPDSTSVAIVLDANEHYVKSVVRVMRAPKADGEGGSVAAGRVIARGTASSAGAVAVARGGRAGSATLSPMVTDGEMVIQGIGPIPNNEIQHIQSATYAAGQLGPNTVHVLVIKLK